MSVRVGELPRVCFTTFGFNKFIVDIVNDCVCGGCAIPVCQGPGPGLHSGVCCAIHGCVCRLDTGVSSRRNDPVHHRGLKPEPGATDTWCGACGAQLHPDLCPQSTFKRLHVNSTVYVLFCRTTTTSVNTMF